MTGDGQFFKYARLFERQRRHLAVCFALAEGLYVPCHGQRLVARRANVEDISGVAPRDRYSDLRDICRVVVPDEIGCMDRIGDVSVVVIEQKISVVEI